MTLQSSRRLVVSPSPLSRGLSIQDGGSGMRRPMGRWNFRRLGSTVTMGLNVAWLPSSLVTSSSGTGWACEVPKGEAQPGAAEGPMGGDKSCCPGRCKGLLGAGEGFLLMSCPTPLSEPQPPFPCCSPLPGALLSIRHLSREPHGCPSMLTRRFKHVV